MARSGNRATGAASGWLYEDSWDWTMPGHRAPGWGVRNVKFNTGIVTFTEVRPHRLSYPGVLRFDARTWVIASLLRVIDATTFEHEEIIRVPAIVNDPPQSFSPRLTSTSTPPSPPPLPNHRVQTYVRALSTNDDAGTTASSPLPPRLPHIPVPPLHTHPLGHGHYHHHHSYNPAPLVGPTGGDRERWLRVRVRQIRDVLLTTNAPSVSPSGSGVTSMIASAAAAPTCHDGALT